MLEWHLRSAAGGESGLKHEISVREKAITLLKDYSFDPENNGAPWPPGLVGGGVMWGS
jgi:hypothetical protein